ncbi:MAG: hypothetical protein EZS28_045643, partial [Streblomastix strix]
MQSVEDATLLTFPFIEMISPDLFSCIYYIFDLSSKIIWKQWQAVNNQFYWDVFRQLNTLDKLIVRDKDGDSNKDSYCYYSFRDPVSDNEVWRVKLSNPEKPSTDASVQGVKIAPVWVIYSDSLFVFTCSFLEMSSIYCR